MSSASSTAESSTRVHQDVDMNPDPEQEPEQPQRPWVALVSAPVILDPEDERAVAMPQGTDVQFNLHDPPHPSYLVLHPRIAFIEPGLHFAMHQSAYILAADPSGRLLFSVVANPLSDDTELYLCDAHTRRATVLPAIPYTDLLISPERRRSIALIANPTRHGHYLVAQIHPRSSSRFGDRLLCYCTATLKWFFQPLVSTSQARMHDLLAETAVFAYANCLWWPTLACGVFVCDPFADCPELRFIPLPAGCEVSTDLFPRVAITRRRRIAPSMGWLRYVEIRGRSVTPVAPDVVPASPPLDRDVVLMWTLVGRPEELWKLEYTVPLAEVWAHESYVAAGLQQGEVPHVALIDPYDHRVVYFFLGPMMFGLELPTRRVISCEECPVSDPRNAMLRHSRAMIDAWDLSPPTPPPSEPSEDGRRSFDDPSRDEQTIKNVEDWLNLNEPATETGEGNSPN